MLLVENAAAFLKQGMRRAQSFKGMSRRWWMLSRRKSFEEDDAEAEPEQR